MVEIFPIYRKVIKVIKSSETFEHLEGARKYIQNFLTTYSIPHQFIKRKIDVNNLNTESNVEIRKPNTIVAHMYEEIFTVLESTERNIVKKINLNESNRKTN
jgi:hypothetical protein